MGAILRSAEVFGARAVVGVARHAAPETGALAKAASGALERQPYLRVAQPRQAIETLKAMGYVRHRARPARPRAISARRWRGGGTGRWRWCSARRGRGCGRRRAGLCDALVRIRAAGAFGSLNVSNAAAVALYAARRRADDDEDRDLLLLRQPGGAGAGRHGAARAGLRALRRAAVAAEDRCERRPVGAPAPAATPARPTAPREPPRPAQRPKPRKRKKPLGRRVLGEVWDLLDDIFD